MILRPSGPGELLRLHGIGVLDIFEHFRRETRQPLEMQLFRCSKRITDLEIAGIRNAHDIAGIGLIDNTLFLGHEGSGCGKLQSFA